MRFNLKLTRTHKTAAQPFLIQKMQVKIHKTAFIRPTKPPFDQNHILSLSHLDTDRNLDVILHYYRVYAANNRLDADPFQVITTALSAVLVHYYPLAGILRRRQSDGRLELHCHVDDGLPVINAGVNCDLKYLDADADGKFADQLVPDPNEGFSRPMTLQVTKFRCGGFVLGTAMHHTLCDGNGATMFFNAMAELARGVGRVTIDPVWDRMTLLGPRNPPRVEFPIQQLLSLDKDSVAYKVSGKRVIKECFTVKEKWLDQQKRVLFEKSGLKFTTFEALGVFIWRARTKAYKLHGNEKLTFANSINIRKLVNPPLPVGYWGNGCVPMYVHLTANDLINQPIWKTMNLIKESKYKVKDEYVRSFIDFQELYYKQGITIGRRVSGFTDWRHLAHSTVDFGWGGPVAVVPLSTHFLGSVEPCFFMKGNDGVEVLVYLEEDAIQSFREEMGKLFDKEDGLKSNL